MVRINVEETEEVIGVEATAVVAVANRFPHTPAPRHHHGNRLPLAHRGLGWVFLPHPHRRIIAVDEAADITREDGVALLQGCPEPIQVIRDLRLRTSTKGPLISIETSGDTDDPKIQVEGEQEGNAWATYCDLYR